MRTAMRVAVVLAMAAAACSRPAGSGAGAPAGGGHPACAGGTVDLQKLSGDWIASQPVVQPEGVFAPNQYRIRFETPAADGTVKAALAWRLDSRPFSGSITKNALGAELALLEEMAPEVIEQLKKANNQDPNLPMRAAVRISPAETGCVLSVVDNFQTFVGEKVIEKTSPIGTLKLVPAPATPVLSFTRCTGMKAVYFDGKADDDGGPVTIAAGKAVPVKAEGDPALIPAGCTPSADLYVDGGRVAEKIAGAKDKDAIAYTGEVILAAGPPHGVEIHVFADCGEERKFVASACNIAFAE